MNNLFNMLKQKKEIFCVDFDDTNMFNKEHCVNCHQRAMMGGEIYSAEVSEYIIYGCCHFFEELEDKLNREQCSFIDFYKSNFILYFWINRYQNYIKQEGNRGEKIFK